MRHRRGLGIPASGLLPRRRRPSIQRKCLRTFISGGDLLLMKPITCHMDYSTNEQVEIHPQVEGHLMDARAQGG